ncbi:AAA family ATPase [bacterium]|nr:AAA family ATPase [bacterium]
MKCPVCKKNISDQTLKCPYCKTRVGLLCNSCGTINPAGSVVCKNCSNELLKICKNCGSVNFPNAPKCRKCNSPFKKNNKDFEEQKLKLEYIPKFYTRTQALNILSESIRTKEKKVFSISGEKGIGKSLLLKKVIKNLENEKIHWCIGKCTDLTQVTPGGVIQDMMLNLFKLPNFCDNSEHFKKDAIEFFSKSFRFLNTLEINDFYNFLYNFNDGNYEDIINNKKRIYGILERIFETLNNGHIVFVIDNFDFIDGFSAEFLNNFMQKDTNWKNLRFIAIYNEHKPINSFFGLDEKDIDYFLDINLAPLGLRELEEHIQPEAKNYLTQREKDVIFGKSNGNPAFVEQAVSYSFDCQISDKAFLLPNTFSQLISERLATLKKNNPEAYKLLSGAAILGDRLNLILLKEVFGYKSQEFNDIILYLVKSNFIRPHNEIYYEFNNLLLWENVLKSIAKDSGFSDINVKVGKALSAYNLNINATMAMIAHNLKENRMAFDIWTKTTRLASYVGDVNLYVIAQKQCLALINEFNENETLNIRYNISERLGKLLSEYDPQEAMEFLPDAIANARANNDETKEIELLSYLAKCCKKSGNYFGNVECVDNVLKKLKPSQEIEIAMIKSSKLSALLNIGNCGEIVDLVDNDILPKLNNFLSRPKLDNSIPISLIYDTWLRVKLVLASALALQGNDRSFEILTEIFESIEKKKINDLLLVCRAKLVLAYANTIKGDFATSYSVLDDIDRRYRADVMDSEAISQWNLIYITNKFLLKDYDNIREILFDSVTYANNTGENFTKNILKVFLGKTFKDDNKAKHAIKIYDEQIDYFAKEKMAFGALLTWYLIAEATIITENPKNAVDIANQALEIAQNPRINNFFFVVKLKIILALAHIELSDFETAKMDIETAIKTAKKYNMNDLLSRLYLLYGSCYQDIGSRETQIQPEYLKGAVKMYDKALDIVNQKTGNPYIKKYVQDKKQILQTFCQHNNIQL